ncbi:MAG: ABC transporter permease [Bacillota bacterium]|nr:ABC transporter permease [Bacillota bacterium]
MGRYLARRLIQAVPVLFIVSLITFFVMHLMPGGPLAAYMNSPGLTAEGLARLKHYFGLDRPLYVQYLSWLGELVKGNLGTSFVNGQPVLGRILERIPATLALMLPSFLLSVILAVPIGVVGAVRKYSWIDYLLTIFAYFGIAMPTFWFGIMLVIFFAVRLGWLPAQGWLTPGMGFSWTDLLRHLILPMTVLALYSVASWSRYLRSSLLETLGKDFVRTARAKGLAEATVVLRHALRNALIPLVTVLAMDMPTLFSGALITETVFAWPGMGNLFYVSLTKRDYPVLMGILVFVSFLVVVFNLLADVLYGLLDPRIQYE